MRIYPTLPLLLLNVCTALKPAPYFLTRPAAINLPLKMSSSGSPSSSSSSKDDYYANIKTKWAEGYPSSGKINDTWAFYKECGYADPQATLRSMLEPVDFTKKRILDYGCDKGEMLDFFCSGIDGVEGHGIDINDRAIKFAKQKYPTYAFQAGDGMKIPYPDKHFDVVVLISTIKHIRYEDRAAVYAELNRVANYAFIIEADKTEQKQQELYGWTFYNSNFGKEFEENFARPVKVVREAGDILGIYECKKYV